MNPYRLTPTPDGLLLTDGERRVAKAVRGDWREIVGVFAEIEAMDRDSRDETLHPAVRMSAMVSLRKLYGRYAGRNDGRRS